MEFVLSNADPVFVNFPRLLRARGHTAGHTSEFASPRRAMKSTVTGKISSIGLKVPRSMKVIANTFSTGVSIAPSEKTTPSIVHIFNALTCFRYLGIKIIPRRYPRIILRRVRLVKYFDDSIGILMDWPYLIIVSPAITSTPT